MFGMGRYAREADIAASTASAASGSLLLAHQLAVDPPNYSQVRYLHC